MSDGSGTPDELKLASLLSLISSIENSAVYISASNKESEGTGRPTDAEKYQKERFRGLSLDAGIIQTRMAALASSVTNSSTLAHNATLMREMAEIKNKGKRARNKLQAEDPELAPLDKLAANKAAAAAIKTNIDVYHTLCDINDAADDVIDGSDDPDAETTKVQPIADLVAAGIEKCITLDHEMVIVLHEGWDVLQYYRRNPVALSTDDAKALKKAKILSKENKPSLKKAPAGGGGRGGGGRGGGGRGRGQSQNYSQTSFFAPPQPAFQQPQWSAPPHVAQPAGSTMSVGGRPPSGVGPCHICHLMGHLKAQCPNR